MSINGFVKIYRKMTKWRWYGDDVTKSVFLHLLLTANFKEKSSENITLKPGQVITSVRKLSKDLRHTERQTRTALNRLKSTHEITVTATNRYSLITLVNWEKYQVFDGLSDTPDDDQYDDQATHCTQKNDTQNDNNIRNKRKNKELKELYKGENNIAKPEEKICCGKYRNVLLTHTEFEEVFGWDSGDTLERFSERLYYRGYRYDDHYKAIKKWREDDMLKSFTERARTSYDIEEFERRANELPVYKPRNDPAS